MNIADIDNKKCEKWLKKIDEMREMFLANLVMLCQIPAPTFQEEKRAEFILNRYVETGLFSPYKDNINNVIGVLEGKKSNKKIMINAHIDNIFRITDDHNIKVSMDCAQGAGVADNGAGLAALITLPDIIRGLGIEFDSDIVFVATAQSIGRGDLEGIRSFFKNTDMNLDFSINLEGVQLGRVDYFSLSNVRCDIKCNLSLDEPSVWGQLGSTNAIFVINDLMNGLFSIPIPQKPKTILNIGLLEGGEAYDAVSSIAGLSLEIRSEQDKITDSIMQKVIDVCNEVSIKHSVEIHYEFFGRQHSSGLNISHPVVKTCVDILETLGVTPDLRPSSGEITVPLQKKIPSITVGITNGKKSSLPNGLVFLEPISKGLLQLVLLIYAIDKGLCNGS